MLRIRDPLVKHERKTYVKKSEKKSEEMVDCGGGKNYFGTSPKVSDMAKRYSGEKLWEMPDVNYLDLKRAIKTFWSEHAELDVDNIKVANGSCVMLERINKIFLQEKSRVLGFAPQFTAYIAEVVMGGGYYKGIPLRSEDSFQFQVDRILHELTNDYDLLYIDNPNNPTGQLIHLNDIEEIVRQARKQETAVIVDEAYGDYVDEKHSAVNLFNSYDNVMITKTFSKGYGIAKFRIGYGIIPKKWVPYFNKIEIPFPVCDLSAGLAQEALTDRRFIMDCRKWVEKQKTQLTEALIKKDYIIGKTFPSCPIFLLGTRDVTLDLEQDLLNKGIITRSGKGFYNLGSNFVRVNTPGNIHDFLSRL